MTDRRQLERIELLSELRVKRELQCWQDGDIVLVPQLCIVTNWPYVKMKAESHHLVPDGRGELHRIDFRARSGHLPVGHDRSLGQMIFGESMRVGPFVPWSKPQDYFKRVGICSNGKNRGDLVERFRRWKNVEVVVNGNPYRAIGRSHLPKTIDPDTSGPFNGEYGVLVDEDFYRFLHGRKAVPIPAAFLRAVKDPQLQDFCIFLYWRSVAAKSVSFIGWDLLRRQFPQDDCVKSRMWHAMEEACNIWRAIWPEFGCEATQERLIVRPSRRPFLIGLPTSLEKFGTVEDTRAWKTYLKKVPECQGASTRMSQKRTQATCMST